MKKFLVILCFSILLLPLIASAITLNLDYPSFRGIDLEKDQELGQVVAWFYYFVVGISGFAAFVMLVWGGIQWISSAGSPGQIKDARDRIQNALLGLLLVLGSFLILQIINPELTILRTPGLQGLEPTPSGIRGKVFGGQCDRLLSGKCSDQDNFSMFGAQTQTAQLICQQESKGSATAKNPGCFLRGNANSCELSVGLMQYNLVDRCAGLVTGEVTPSGGILRCTCEVPDQNALIALNACLSDSGAAWRVRFAFDLGVKYVSFYPVTANIARQVQKGFEVFNDECGSGQGSWSPWSTRAQCGITASCLPY